jgi:hypothetical protein
MAEVGASVGEFPWGTQAIPYPDGGVQPNLLLFAPSGSIGLLDPSNSSCASTIDMWCVRELVLYCQPTGPTCGCVSESALLDARHIQRV